MGRWCTILGVLVSIGTAYLVMQFLSIMDYVQALFSFFIAPLFGTVLLGMLWKRATPAGGFWGLLARHAVLDRHVGLGEGGSHGARVHRAFAARQGHGGKHVPRAVVMAHLCAGDGGGEPDDASPSRKRNWWAWCTAAPRCRRKAICRLYQRPIFWAGVVAVVFVILNIIFW